MRCWTQAGVLLGCALLVGGLSSLLHPSHVPWYETEFTDQSLSRISGVQVQALKEKGRIVWIDARKRSEYEMGHLPDAILLNAEEWADLMFVHQLELQEAYGSPVIVYCDGTGCERSAEIAQRLRELIGLDPVFILDGDWRELDRKGGSPEQSDEGNRVNP